MGSRMMHLIIANQVGKKLKVQNRLDFLIGGIAPDAVYTFDGKNKSHFYEGNLDDGTRFVNYKVFIEKYHSEIQNDYILGYLTHIVSDDIWLKSVYFKNNFKKRLESDSNLLERWHGDFRKLNGKLVEEFDCSSLKNKLIEANSQINNSFEINSSDLERFKEEALNDFIYRKEDLGVNLQVFSLGEIIDYIDLATSTAFKICSAVKNKQGIKRII